MQIFIDHKYVWKNKCFNVYITDLFKTHAHITVKISSNNIFLNLKLISIFQMPVMKAIKLHESCVKQLTTQS